jgi:hypothetical protein
MKFTLALCLCLALASSYQFQERSASYNACLGGKAYQVKYATYGLADEHFVTLETVEDLTSYLCNIDSTEVNMEFSSVSELKTFASSLVPYSTFLVEGSTFSCPVVPNVPRTLVRRVLAWNTTEGENILTLRVVPALLDEIFKEASVGVKKTGPCLTDWEENVCIGANTQDCSIAESSLPLYSNKYLSVTCSSCFLGLDADVFLDLEISWWHLKRLAGGFKNIRVKGALVESLSATEAWSAGIDKSIAVVQPTTILSFNIGPIPIRLWFEVPVEITADLSFYASAAAKVGVEVDWKIGDAYLKWDHSSHWSPVGPSPSLTWTPVLSGSASFNANGDLSFLPTFILHVDNVFDYKLKAIPVVNAKVTGDVSEEKICAQASGSLKLTGEADLNINIPFVHLGDKHFGPYTYYSKEFDIFPETCEKAA